MTDTYTTLWKRISDEVALAREDIRRALEPSASNVFTWNDEECWVDRARWVVIPASMAEMGEFSSESTIPDAKWGREMLLMFAGAERSEGTLAFVKFLTRFVRPNPMSASVAGYHFLNAVAIQPLVNPAFEPLFWIVIASDLGKRFQRENIYAELAPMMFDMSRWPESREDAPTVREHQAALVAQHAPELATDAGAVDEPAWAERCWSLFKQGTAGVPARILRHVFEYA